jgi:hypothetical protein
MSESLGSRRVPIESHKGIQDQVVEVVDASIPLLLGLDFMDRIGATPNIAKSRIAPLPANFNQNCGTQPGAGRYH